MSELPSDCRCNKPSEWKKRERAPLRLIISYQLNRLQPLGHFPSWDRLKREGTRVDQAAKCEIINGVENHLVVVIPD